MGFLVFIILVVIVAICAALYASLNKEYKTEAWITCGASALIAIFLLIVGTIVIVPTGNIAVMTRFSRVTGQVFPNGLGWKNIVDSPQIMSIQTQLYTDDGVTAASRDLQDVTIALAINYKLNPQAAPNLYQTVGRDYISVIAHPAILETIKETTSKYDAGDLILKRSDVKSEIASILTGRLAERGIIIESVNLKNIGYSEQFTAAIEAKVSAQQAVFEAQNKLERIKVEAQQAEAEAVGKANAVIAAAKGQAESIRIVTEAQVKSNTDIEQTLTPEVLQYILLDRLAKNVQTIIVPQGQGFVLPDLTK